MTNDAKLNKTRACWEEENLTKSVISLDLKTLSMPHSQLCYYKYVPVYSFPVEELWDFA